MKDEIYFQPLTLTVIAALYLYVNLLPFLSVRVILQTSESSICLLYCTLENNMHWMMHVIGLVTIYLWSL